MDASNTFIDATIRGSHRHVVLSTVLFAAVLAFELALHAGGGVIASVLAMYAFIVVYNVLRVRNARAARASEADGQSFIEAQRRSHRIRRKIFLVTAPILVAFTWCGMLAAPEGAPPLVWYGLSAATIFLTYGWARWWRARFTISSSGAAQGSRTPHEQHDR